jgi:hypothetical protein
MMPTERGWAVAGKNGLYIGWWHRRGDAIAGHVRDVRRIEEPETSGFYLSRLTEDQSKLWRKCRQRGDRVVRVKLAY